MAPNNQLTPWERPVAGGIATLSTLLDSQKAKLAAVCATKVTPERLLRVAVACVEKTPALRNTTPMSILRSIMGAAELGLEAGSALGEAYLVPFKDVCQLIIGYRGLITLAYRSGMVASIQADVVYEGDVWEYEQGLTPKLRHVPTGAEVNPQKITHAYCVVNLKEGGQVYGVMKRAEVDAIRGRSRAGGNGPWVTDYGEMAKKTVLRRVLKTCPMSIEMQRAMSADDAAETGDFSAFDFDLPVKEEKKTKAERISGEIAAKESVDPGTGEVTPHEGLVQVDGEWVDPFVEEG